RALRRDHLPDEGRDGDHPRLQDPERGESPEDGLRVACPGPARCRPRGHSLYQVGTGSVSGGSSGSATACAALARARSWLMCTAAEVRGAARTMPTIPKMAPAEMVTIRTARGFKSSVAPKAIGCTMFWSAPLARITITSMIRAVVVPCEARARITAKAPAT